MGMAVWNGSLRMANGAVTRKSGGSDKKISAFRQLTSSHKCAGWKDVDK